MKNQNIVISEAHLRRLVRDALLLEKYSPFDINTKIGNLETLASKDKKLTANR